MQIPVVYVHGFIGHLDFPELRDGLDASRTLSPTLLGYGALAGTLPSGLGDQVAHLDRTLKTHFGEQPVVLVGHSGGAAICVEFATQFPGRVAAFVSAEGNLAPSDAFLSSRLAPMTRAQVEQWLASAQADPAAFSARKRLALDDASLVRLRDWLHHQPAATIHIMARSLLMETVSPRYASRVVQVMTNIPTYLARGANSEVALGAPPRLRTLAAGTFAIPNTGHLMILEQPGAVAAMVRSILEDITAPGDKPTQPRWTGQSIEPADSSDELN
jgi:pimeloyl-ACP methyl ester carboxylesterase